MRVIIIANGFQEDYIQNLIPGVAKHITKIEFIGSDIYSFPDNSHIEFHNLRGSHDENAGVPRKAIRLFNYYIKLIWYLVKSKASVVHVKWVRFEWIDGVIIPFLIQLLGKKVIYTAHNVIPHNTSGWWWEFKFKRIYLQQDLILVHSTFIKDELIAKFGIRPEKVTVLSHGVYRVPDNKQIDKASAKKELGIPDDKFVVLFFGKISKYKGFDLLVKASELMKNTHDRFFLVAGKVNPDYKDEFDQIRQRCKDDSFLFLSKHLSEREVEVCFKASDVCVLPYREASQSGVLFMAYAYGRPVIAPNIGGFKEDIVLGKTGLLFSGAEEASLASVLDTASSVEFLDSKDMKEYVESTYSWDTIGKNLANIYKRLI